MGEIAEGPDIRSSDEYMAFIMVKMEAKDA